MKKLVKVGLLALAIVATTFITVFTNNNSFAEENANKADEKINISIKTDWVGYYWGSFFVELYADGEFVKKDAAESYTDWEFEFKDLPKYNAEGREIKYTINVDDESLKENNFVTTISGDAENGFVVKNTLLTNVPFTKYWNDIRGGYVIARPGTPSPASFRPGKRVATTSRASGIQPRSNNNASRTSERKFPDSRVPLPESITVHLVANGKIVQTKVVTAADNWEAVFEKVPMYDNEGNQIDYELREEPVKGFKIGKKSSDFILNKTIFDIPVEKKWVGNKKEGAEVSLYRDYEKTEYDNNTGNEVKVPVKGELVETVTLNEANNWKYTFKDVEEYYADVLGHSKYKYYIKETEIDGYKTVISGDDVKGFTIKNIDKSKMSIPVEKTWKGKTADEVEVVLKADGVEKETVKLSEANDWKHTFENLDRLNDNDELINYTVEEKALDNYKTVLKQKDPDDISKGVEITNYELIDLKITKYWNEMPAPRMVPTGVNGDFGVENAVVVNNILAALGADKAEKSVVPLPQSITIHLLADGEVINTKVLTKADNWTYTVEKLPLYSETDGHRIKYELKEDAVEGYKTSLVEFDFITNKSIIDIPVEKKWVGKAKDEVEVQLYREYDKTEYELLDGSKKVTKMTELVDTIKLNKANSWKYTFKDLEEFYVDSITSTKYKYYVKEIEVDGYQSEIKQNDEEDVTKGIVITNSEKPVPTPDPEPNPNPQPNPNPAPQPDPKPEQPKASIPQTGIDANIIMSLGLMTASGMGLGIYVKKKRK